MADDDVRQAIGAGLRAERERRQLDVSECAAALGVKWQHWWQFERGERLPSLERFALLCRRLKFDPRRILGDAKPPE